MDSTQEKLYAPVTFKETFTAHQTIERIERALPGKSHAEVRRHIFRLGLKQVAMDILVLEGGK